MKRPNSKWECNCSTYLWESDTIITSTKIKRSFRAFRLKAGCHFNCPARNGKKFRHFSKKGFNNNRHRESVCRCRDVLRIKQHYKEERVKAIEPSLHLLLKTESCLAFLTILTVRWSSKKVLYAARIIYSVWCCLAPSFEMFAWEHRCSSRTFSASTHGPSAFPAIDCSTLFLLLHRGANHTLRP
jgi:hypothetical protein